jgi:SAM-dependent methyltransferase
MSPIRAVRRLWAGWAPGGRRTCAVCGSRVRAFLPYRNHIHPPLMRALGVVGSDIRNYQCPRCGAHDRERHLMLYLQACGLLEKLSGKQVLHFAPESRLSRIIAAAGPARYVRCDLFPQSMDVRRIDMLNMDLQSGEFDVLIANHVLEHVADDRKALSEIIRVLKPGGWCILQTPYSAILHNTWEDPGIESAATRLQAYGQEDHVRLYGRDVFERFASAGLEPDIQRHEQVLGHIDAEIAGVNREEPLFLMHRN